MRTLRLGMVALAFLTVVGACVGGGEDSINDDQVQGALPAGAAEDLDALFADASAYQKGLLEGDLTRQEYEAAALSAQQCIQEGGLEAELILGDPLITLQIAEDVAIGGGVFGSAPDLVKDCYHEYLDAVETRFLFDNAPSQNDLRAETERFYECLRQKGYPIPENAFEDPGTGAAVDAADYDDLLACWDTAGS